MVLLLVGVEREDGLAAGAVVCAWAVRPIRLATKASSQPRRRKRGWEWGDVVVCMVVKMV